MSRYPPPCWPAVQDDKGARIDPRSGVQNRGQRVSPGQSANPKVRYEKREDDTRVRVLPNMLGR